MKLVEEFKKFAMRGNVVDMAVGIILGAAFKDIVTALVEKIIMPPLGFVTAKVDVKDLAWELPVPGSEPVAIGYGAFLNSVFTFLIIAVVVFLLVKGVNEAVDLLDGEDEPEEPTTKSCDHCQSKIPIRATRCPCCTSHLAAEPT
jgi:large conductance mechanosensitive channel